MMPVKAERKHRVCAVNHPQNAPIFFLIFSLFTFSRIRHNFSRPYFGFTQQANWVWEEFKFLFLLYKWIFITTFRTKKKRDIFQHWIGTYWTRPDDQPIVRITCAVFSCFGWKHMNEACSASLLLPLTKNAGDMLTVIRSMVVLNIATFGEFLNKTAIYLPSGSQQMLCGMPPISIGPQFVLEKSAIGNDCLGAVVAA